MSRVILAAWTTSSPPATAPLLLGGRDIDRGSVVVLPPVTRPSKNICVGPIYADHVAEAKLEKPQYPELFARFPTSLVGHGSPIVRPGESTALDFEAELAFVIRRSGRRIAVEDALSRVAGYSIFNDGSLRDYQMRTPQWTMGKTFDRTGAFGPWLVPRMECRTARAGTISLVA